MGLFGFFKGEDINSGYEKYKGTEGAILLDVRTEEEYNGGHIPSSINIPLQTIGKTTEIIKDKDSIIFVYCRSGARSSQATANLKEMGYTNVTNIGGIMDFKGNIEK